ncbi:MAG: hypothetical protein JKX79_12640 [Labilibaculum sp.]|nr:hypothetical protein [Labilibaculum sp.]
MGKISFVNYPNKYLNVKFPKITSTITIDLYDDVIGFDLTHIATNVGFGTNVTNNEKTLLGLIESTGIFEIKINTVSEGIYIKEIEILSKNTTLSFNKINYDFELKRVDLTNNNVANLTSQTFISTDNIRIKFRELQQFDLTKDGFKLTEVVWETKGVTTDDGTPNLQNSTDNSIYIFIPNPINRPNQSGRGARQPNNPIEYETYCTVIGLKKKFECTQDTKDIIRQEYLDFGTTWQPTRNEVFLDNGRWNTGNYTHLAAQGTNQFQTIFNAILTHYNASCNTNRVRANGIDLNSAYRNPQRNKAVGSRLINSNHTIGHAMDIRILGARTTQKWGFLRTAALQINGVNAICEIGPRQVLCSNPNISHIHVSW